MTCHYPDLGSASDYLELISYEVRPIRKHYNCTQIWLEIMVISVEFLHSFLRCYFAGNPAVELLNIGCFVLLLLFTHCQSIIIYFFGPVQIKLRSTSDQNLDIHCTFLQGFTDAFKWVDGVRRRLAIACL